MLKIGLCLMLLWIQKPAQNKLLLSKTVTVEFLNNSSRAKEFRFISYVPDEDNNGTVQVGIEPDKTYKASFSVGTKLYLADNKQVALVMSGRRLIVPAFKIISEKDNNKTILLNQ